VASRGHALALPGRGRFTGGPLAGSVRLLAATAGEAPSSKPSEGSASKGWVPSNALFTRFVDFVYKNVVPMIYPPKAEICNCGITTTAPIPQPELLAREDIKQGSLEWRMQIYGAALYWHMATTPTNNPVEVDVNLLRDKDVLEVGCMRGGGARYLSVVAGTRSYVATEAVEVHVDECRQLHRGQPVSYEVADATNLSPQFSAESFDFVLCVEAAAKFGDFPGFVEGVKHVLRPGGRLLLCDKFLRVQYEKLMAAVEAAGFIVEAEYDIGREVHAVGICRIPPGRGYVRMVARKATAEEAEKQSVEGSPAEQP